MSEYEFICPDCKRRLEVTASVYEAILSSGCPVCSSPVTDESGVAKGLS